MATATAMYHTGLNTLKGISRDERKSERVDIVKGEKRRRLHKAFLRYHDPNNWPLLREALKTMGRADLIGNGQHHLIPNYQPAGAEGYQSARRKNATQAGSKTSPVTLGRASGRHVKPGTVLSQHTGLPPRAGTGTATGSKPSKRRK
jgi:Domain of unknown function (DUF3362)